MMRSSPTSRAKPSVSSSDMTQTNGADLLVAALLANDVDVVFTLPGLQLDPVFDALAKRRGEFSIYQVRHEQAAAYMADGFARVTGRPACCLVVPGPGLLNAMAGLSTAYACSSPVLCFAGQTPSGTIDAGLGLLHEINNQLEIVKAVVSWSGRAERGEDIPQLVKQAVAEMMTGRTRPVCIEVSPDVLAANCPAPLVIPAAEISPVKLPLDQIERAAELISRADRPLIVAGGGVNRSAASTAVTALADRLGAPVIMTTNGKGAISARNALAYNAPAIRLLLPRADVVIAVGTRFAKRDGKRWDLRPDQALIKIDIDGAEVARGIEPAVPVEGDAGEVLDAILGLLAPTAAEPGWGDLSPVRKQLNQEIEDLQPQAAFGRAIREALPDDTIVIDGMNQIGYWSRIGFPVYQERTFISPGYQGTLGFELPTGLGAKVAAPDRPVVVIAGDGGFMFNVGELATAVQHNLNVVTVVFNDNAFGNVLRTQDEAYGGRIIASELHNPDFVRLAESFGAIGRRADGPDQLGHCLREALTAVRPTVIEVPVGRMPDPWPLIQSH
jgi:acetolactate synthase I/II/III large subunit